jgi:hypothetical protein
LQKLEQAGRDSVRDLGSLDRVTIWMREADRSE